MATAPAVHTERATARTENRAVTWFQETKHSAKTTELYAFLAIVAGILVAAASIKGGDSGGTDAFIAKDAWLYVSIVTGAYLVSRGLAKSGSVDRDRDER